MKSKKTGLIVIVIIVLMVIFSVIRALPSDTNNEIHKLPTSFSNGREGIKAYYLMLKKLGFVVRRYEKNMEVRMDEIVGQGMIIYKPFESKFDEIDAKMMYEWAESGNGLLVASDESSPFWKLLKVREISVKAGETSVKTDEEGELVRGVRSVKVRGNYRFILPAGDSHPFKVHLKDRHGVICASVKIGYGEVYILSTPAMLDNSMISKEDNCIFAANLASSLANEKLIFNEAVHGYLDSGEGFVMPESIRFMLIQVIILLVVFYLTYLNRFGRIRDSEGFSERASVEYVHSLAGLFMRARAVDYAADSIWRGYRQKVLKLLRMPCEPDDEVFLRLVAEGAHDEGAGAQVLEQWIKLRKSGNLDEKSLMEFTGILDGAMEKMKEY